MSKFDGFKNDIYNTIYSNYFHFKVYFRFLKKINLNLIVKHLALGFFNNLSPKLRFLRPDITTYLALSTCTSYCLIRDSGSLNPLHWSCTLAWLVVNWRSVKVASIPSTTSPDSGSVRSTRTVIPTHIENHKKFEHTNINPENSIGNVEIFFWSTKSNS